MGRGSAGGSSGRLILIRALISNGAAGDGDGSRRSPRRGRFSRRSDLLPWLALIFALTNQLTRWTLRYRVERHRWLIDLQLAGDALIVLGVSSTFTGGIASFLLLVPCTLPGRIRRGERRAVPARGAILVATLSNRASTAGLVAVAVLLFRGWSGLLPQCGAPPSTTAVLAGAEQPAGYIVRV